MLTVQLICPLTASAILRSQPSLRTRYHQMPISKPLQDPLAALKCKRRGQVVLTFFLSLRAPRAFDSLLSRGQPSFLKNTVLRNWSASTFTWCTLDSGASFPYLDTKNLGHTRVYLALRLGVSVILLKFILNQQRRIQILNHSRFGWLAKSCTG